MFAFQEDGYKPLRWRRLICQRNQTHDHSPEEASSVEAATHSLLPPATLDQAVRQPAACQITAGLVSIYRRAPFLLCKGGCYFTRGFGSQELCRGWATVRESATLFTSRQRKAEAGAQSGSGSNLQHISTGMGENYTKTWDFYRQNTSMLNFGVSIQDL